MAVLFKTTTEHFTIYTLDSFALFCLSLQVPLFIPAIFSFTCFFMVFLSLYSDPVNTGIGFAISLTGIPAYYVFIVFDRRPKWLQKGLGNTLPTCRSHYMDFT